MPPAYVHKPSIYQDDPGNPSSFLVRSANIVISVGGTPIAYLQNATLTAQRQLQKLIELGTEETYFVPFRVFGILEAERAMGPSQFFNKVGCYFPTLVINGFKNPITLYAGRLTQAVLNASSNNAVMMENVVMMGDLNQP